MQTLLGKMAIHLAGESRRQDIAIYLPWNGAGEDWAMCICSSLIK